MKYDEHWLQIWQQYMDFMDTELRRPSKYYPEERPLFNWMKHNKKLLNKGLLSSQRESLFAQLLVEANQLRHVNQYFYSTQIEKPSQEEGGDSSPSDTGVDGV